MKNKIRKVLVLIILMILILSIPGSVQANVQSRGDKSHLTQKNVSQFFELIRQMETTSGPMGLSATIEQGTKNGGKTILETSSSNNIDVHMIKNTEWGTVAMLTDSVYGSKINGGNGNVTTSGNNSGVFQYAVGIEFVAGMWNTKNNYNEYIYYADNKYWDKYDEQIGKIGDATTETIIKKITNDYYTYWKNGSDTNYSYFVNNTNPVFYRGGNGIFYSCYVNWSDPSRYSGKDSNTATSRAVVVNGTGF